MEFQVGEQVEVIMQEEGFKGSYYTGTIVSKEGTSQYKMEYKTLLKEDESGPLEEVINIDLLRPVQPSVPVIYFDLYQLVDAYENDGWWVGIICGKFQSNYFVYFPSIEKQGSFPLEKLRKHQEWHNREWNPAKLANKTEISLPTPTNMNFQTGEQVEVMLKEEDLEGGSYYVAKIISVESPSQYKVEYKTLLNKDKSGPLEESVGVDQLRPLPPQVPVSYFSLHDLVDAYDCDCDGWWTGIIHGRSKSDYIVYFLPSKAKALYPLKKLRVHQEWSNGQWIPSKTECTTQSKKKLKRKKK